MNAKPTRIRAAVPVFGACSVGAQVVASVNDSTVWQLTWMLVAMITFAGAAIAAESVQKKGVTLLPATAGFK
ncbi:hypothetical protein [Amycolatopsis lurida]|uniref:hypothetical protein n=1 Tax=Amycolatopsis lurida TaxID=31959 RepID=UPI00365E2EDA